MECSHMRWCDRVYSQFSRLVLRIRGRIRSTRRLNPDYTRSQHVIWEHFIYLRYPSLLVLYSPLLLHPLYLWLATTLTWPLTYIGNAAVSGAVFTRIVMGTLYDLFAPHVAFAALILLTAPAVSKHELTSLSEFKLIIISDIQVNWHLSFQT